MLLLALSVLVGNNSVSARPAVQPDTESRDRQAVFGQVWTTARDHFFDPAMNGLDWNAVRAEHEPQILAAGSSREFSAAVNQMLKKLRTSHTFFWTADDVEYYHLLGIFADGPLGETIRSRFPPDGLIRYCGIGILPERIGNRWFVAGALDGSVAAVAGIRRGQELVSVDGNPFEPVRSFAGKAGVAVQLAVRDAPQESPRPVTVVPQWIEPQAAMLEALRSSFRIIPRDGKQIAYAHLWSWAGQQYQDLLAGELLHGSLKDADGLVLDIREGWGGASPEYLNLFSRNLPRLVSTTRDGSATEFATAWHRPVTLLVNQGSRSGKEVIAFGFRKLAIGKVVGTTTGGAVAGGSPFLVGDQAVLYLAVSQVTVDGGILEGTGVAPDQEVPWPFPWSSADDPQLEKALEITRRGIR